MTVTLSLRQEDEKKLADRAAACGQDIASYVQGLIRRDIEQASFAELAAPVHQAVRDSGMTDAELDAVIQEALSDSRRERRPGQTR